MECISLRLASKEVEQHSYFINWNKKIVPISRLEGRQSKGNISGS